MNFRNYIYEESKKLTLKELELLLAHHIEDLKKYKGSNETAYNATLKDIKAIKTAIANIKTNEKKPSTNKTVPGNQNLSSSDSISTSGDSAVSEEMIDEITKQFDRVNSELEILISLMNKVDKKYTRQLKDSLMKIEVTIDNYINTK